MHDPEQQAAPPYDAVVFDCDSTLSAIEGIDELARERREEIAELTTQAMAGALPLEEVYAKRLELIRPGEAEVGRIAALYLEHAVPHARELVGALRELEKQVIVVSGGLKPAVLPFAQALGVEASCVHAVDIHFDERGAYAGFDAGSPLARSGGKIEVLARIRAAAGPRGVAFIGDGQTDLEAAGEVSRFIAFGGVERREAVFRAARYSTERADFAALLPLLCSREEQERLARSAAFTDLLQSI